MRAAETKARARAKAEAIGYGNEVDRGMMHSAGEATTVQAPNQTSIPMLSAESSGHLASRVATGWPLIGLGRMEVLPSTSSASSASAKSENT